MSIAAVDKALTEAAASDLVPGFVAAARLPDGQRFEAAYGARSVAAPTPMTPDTVFWIASFTKLVTTIAALQLVEAGALDLDQAVASILPDFADLPILDGFDNAGAPRLRKATDAPTVRHLLTHTSGLGYTFMDADLARYAEQEGIGPDQARRLPRRFDAGAHWHYGVGIDWAGAVIEAVTGKGLDAVFAERITGPLGMADTTFALTDAQKARAAVMHARLPDGSLVPIDFAMPPPPNFSLGGGGLHSTAADYLRLLRAILDGEILSEASRAALFANQIGDLQAGVTVSSNPALTNDFEPMPGDPKRWSLGLLLNQRPGPDGRPAGSGAWAGLANCYYWIDPKTRVAGVLLTQILPFADAKALDLFARFERAVYA
jgi:CubicO group peptidase (beta-lactamase class C family)